MSYYITCLVSDNVTERQINTISKKHNLCFTQLNNSPVEGQIPSNMKYYLVDSINTENDFICNNNDNMYTQELAEHIAFLTESKCDEVIGLVEKIARQIQNSADSFLNNLTEFLREIFSEFSQSQIGLLQHWYDGLIEKEEITIKTFYEIPIKDIEQFNMPNKMEEDILYKFCVV